MAERLLPEFIEDSPPPRARRIEAARRALLDWFAANDYHLVVTPLVEHLSAPLAVADPELDARTLKLTDTMSGRTLGVRADITPQAARIAAHLEGGVVRLCYCGAVLFAKPPQPWHSREVLQIGAEIYNCADIGGDFEIAALAVGALAKINAPDIAADIGSAAVFNRVAGDASDRAALRAAVARRDRTTIGEIAPPDIREALGALCEINGDEAALDEARARLPDDPAIRAAIDEMAALGRRLQWEKPARVRFDFSELGGYAYHSGAVFALYAGGVEIGRGGRYCAAGDAPAAGFSMDLKQLAEFIPADAPPPAVAAIADPADPAWRAAAAKIQAEGRRIRLLHGEPLAGHSPRLIRNANGEWIVEE